MPDIWKDGTLTLPFWAWGGAQYTIVPGRHIGIDHAPDPAGEPWDVAALLEADVVSSVQTSAIGRVVVTDTQRPTRRYISYCHNYYGDPAPVGTHLTPGGRVARLALAGESPGSAWGGAHSHTVVHDDPRGAYTQCGDTYYDPQVEIDAYLASPAGGAQPRPLLEDTMALIIRRTSDGIIGLVDRQLWAHMPDMATATINAQVQSITDEIHDLDPDSFDRVTRSLGIPDEVRTPGRFWSIESDLQQQLRGLEAKLAGK